MRYIGSKTNLLSNIQEVIEDNVSEEIDVFLDLFSGTGVVGEYFKKKYQILSNDNLYFSHIIQRAKIANNSIPDFAGLRSIGIDEPLTYLETEPIEITDDFFITCNYSPYKECERMYFTVENASRIDFIRQTIRSWKENGLINDNEFAYILAILIEAVPYISNISGTYGAYLKHWDKRALAKLTLRGIDVIDNKRHNVCYNLDANELIKQVSGDMLYIDTPYNGRQYISNYHLLETIALYDNPEIYGKTGLRPYQDVKSKYCMKKTVSKVFEDIIENADFKHIVISYSSDGLLSKTELESIVCKHGVPESYRIYKIPYRKYKSKHKQNSSELFEYIIYIKKEIERNTKRITSPAVQYKKYSGSRYVKSPLNYIGGKYKLLKQILPLFPTSFDVFIDLFAGGLNVGVNVDANKVHANDINSYVIDILRTFKQEETQKIIEHIEMRINEFNLTKYNEDGYKRFREFYNATKHPLDLYTLICYSFNYQFRFNNNHDYNNPFGRNRSHFSDVLKGKLVSFIDEIKSKDIEFTSIEFDRFDLSKFSTDAFVYCDPPYLITTGAYNDGNRGFKNWNRKQDQLLFELLDNLDSRGISFALSNVLSHKGETNELLARWSEKYTIHRLDHSYSNSSHNTKRGSSEEVLITNY